MSTFLATLNPMLTLFVCIAAGFILSKCKILPEGSGKVMAKMETWIFCPALNFTTMAYYCTVDSIGEHFINIILSSFGVLLAVGISIFLAPYFVKKKGPERGVYNYALAFANSGYMGDPIVLALFGNVGLAFFKLYCLPVQLMIYSWGISVMTPAGEKKVGAWRRLINAPTVAMLLGIAVGLSGVGKYIPAFLTNSLDTLKVCMGPVAPRGRDDRQIRFSLYAQEQKGLYCYRSATHPAARDHRILHVWAENARERRIWS